MNKAEFFIPWPSSDLSPNSRKHFRVVAKYKKAARLEAFALARSGPGAWVGGEEMN